MATVYGSDYENDTLYGSNSYDTMFGLNGDDVLVSSASADTMWGGWGVDKFDFNSVSEANGDRIADFHRWEGDKIDLSTIDAKEYSWSSSSTWGNNTFTFKGNVSAAGLGRGDLGYTHYNGDTYVYGNTDSDGTYELQFKVSGMQYFTSSDFAL